MGGAFSRWWSSWSLWGRPHGRFVRLCVCSCPASSICIGMIATGTHWNFGFAARSTTLDNGSSDNWSLQRYRDIPVGACIARPMPSPLGRVDFQNATDFEKTGEVKNVPLRRSTQKNGRFFTSSVTAFRRATFPFGEGRATNGRPYGIIETPCQTPISFTKPAPPVFQTGSPFPSIG